MLTRITPRTLLSCLLPTLLSLPVLAAAPQAKTEKPTKKKSATTATQDKGKKAKATSDKPTEKSVKPGINKRFLSKTLNVDKSKKTFEGESREIFAHRHRIAKHVEIEKGTALADIGAGTGLFLDLFAKGVGEKGKVFAVDIAPNFVEYMGKRAKAKGLDQVEVVQCTGTSCELPEASVDVAFVCDTYHHFEYPMSTLQSLHRAIKPGGRLVIVDFERIPGVSREFIMGHVRCGKKKVIQEIESRGFRYVDEVKVKGLRENYMIRFRRIDRAPGRERKTKRKVVR